MTGKKENNKFYFFASQQEKIKSYFKHSKDAARQRWGTNAINLQSVFQH